MCWSNEDLSNVILSIPLNKYKIPATVYSATPSELSGVFVTVICGGKLNLPNPVLDKCIHLILGISSKWLSVNLSPQYTSAFGFILVVMVIPYLLSIFFLISDGIE